MFTSEIRASIIDDGLNVDAGILCPLIDLLDCPDHGLHPLEPPVVGALHHLQALCSTVKREQTNQSNFGTLVSSSIVWLLYSVPELNYSQNIISSKLTCGI